MAQMQIQQNQMAAGMMPYGTAMSPMPNSMAMTQCLRDDVGLLFTIRHVGHAVDDAFTDGICKLHELRLDGFVSNASKPCSDSFV